MGKILDLDALMSQSMQIKIKGDLINVNQPTKMLVDKLNSAIVKSGKGEIDAAEVVDAQYDIAVGILNNNTSAKKFTRKEVDELPLVVITTIIKEISNFAKGAENDPN